MFWDTLKKKFKGISNFPDVRSANVEEGGSGGREYDSHRLGVVDQVPIVEHDCVLAASGQLLHVGQHDGHEGGHLGVGCVVQQLRRHRHIINYCFPLQRLCCLT